MKVNISLAGPGVVSLILPDNAVPSLENPVSGPGIASATPVLDPTYKDSDALRLACKSLKPTQRVVCDYEEVWPGVDPTLHYGSSVDGSVSLMATSVAAPHPVVAVPTDSGKFVPIFPGISTPELPYGPLHSVVGESELSVMFRSQIAANNGFPWPASGVAAKSLDPVYESEALLAEAAQQSGWEDRIYVQDADGGNRHVAFGGFSPTPFSTYVKQPDGSVVKAA